MKVNIISATKLGKNSANIRFQILKNDGSVLMEDTRGFISNAIDLASAKSSIKTSLKNIRDTFIEQESSRLADAAQSLIGQEFELD